MLRGLEVADQVVMLERRRDEEQRVQHRAEQGETPDPTIQTREPSASMIHPMERQDEQFEDLRICRSDLDART